MRQINVYHQFRPEITIHVLPNISRSKDNQTMKFGQLIEYKLKNIFLQKSCRVLGRETSFRTSSKVLYELKASGLHLSCNIFR